MYMQVFFLLLYVQCFRHRRRRHRHLQFHVHLKHSVWTCVFFYVIFFDNAGDMAGDIPMGKTNARCRSLMHIGRSWGLIQTVQVGLIQTDRGSTDDAWV